MTTESSATVEKPEGTPRGVPNDGTHADETQPILTVIVPAYNATEYLRRNIASLLGVDGVDILIVDDGSTDDTGALADSLAAQHPSVRVIHQDNRGHGGAVNTGIAQARGRYLRVVDADDWVSSQAFLDLITRLQHTSADIVVTNYIYDKVDKSHKHVVRYHSIFPEGRICGWDDTHHFRYTQYLMMHALTLRTEVVRASGLVLPEHTFYVDYLFSFVPLIRARRLLYLDLDLYHYFIGRDDQSVAEGNMIRRADQLVRVNHLMTDAMPRRGEVPDRLYRYMLHYLRINTVITAIMLTLRDNSNRHHARVVLWERMRNARPDVAADLCRGLLGRLSRMRGRVGTALLLAGYRTVVRAMGVN